MTITIRNVTDLESYDYFQEIQRRVWGGSSIDITPTHVTVAVIRSGGGLVCAFADDGPEDSGGMVGGAFWWLGAGVDPDDPPGSPPKLKAHSHMAGVLPEWQSHGIGVQLKLAQRRVILDQGLTDWMTWTYDPLYRRNAVFNLRRLGATSRRFARDIYGDLPDALNAGWPSDRVTVDWRLNSPDILRDANAPRSVQDWDPSGMLIPLMQENQDGFPLPPENELTLDGRTLAIPLPSAMEAIRKVEPELAMVWRLYMRHALEQVFDAGYTLVDCVKMPEYGWHYILTYDHN